MCKEMMKEGYLKKFRNGVHQEEQEEKKKTPKFVDAGSNNMEWIDSEEWKRKIKL